MSTYTNSVRNIELPDGNEIIVHADHNLTAQNTQKLRKFTIDDNGHITSQAEAEKSDITAFGLNGGDVTMTNYEMPEETSAIDPTDTVNEAIGKLEKAIDSGGAGGYPRFTYVTGDVYEHVTGATAPTWQAATYYSRSGSTYTVTSSEPADWSTDWTEYYTKSTGNSIAVDYGE